MGKIRTKEEVVELAEDFMGFVNNFSPETGAFVETITNSHRSLQQNAMRVFIACIISWASTDHEGQYDLRNEATVKLCKKIVDTFGDDLHLPSV